MKVSAEVAAAALAQEAARRCPRVTSAPTRLTRHRTPAPHDAWAAGDESGFQQAVEHDLLARGYWPRQSRYLIATGGTPRGYYAHVVDAQRNPILLDLLVTHLATGMYMEVELKAACGVLSAEQKAILAASPWSAACWTWAQWEATIREFESRVRETERRMQQ